MVFLVLLLPEKMLLQGVRMEEYAKYDTKSLSLPALSSMVGNA